MLAYPPNATYATGSQALRGYNLLNVNRREGKDPNENGGVVEGAGAIAQSAALDTIAETLRAAIVAGTDPQPDTLSLATNAGFARAYTTSFDTRSIVDVNGFVLPLLPGDACMTSLFASPYVLEHLFGGYRSFGLAVPNDAPGVCVLTLGLEQLSTWQLPATGEVAVYPFATQEGVLTKLVGPIEETGLTGALGHPVFVSVASADALPVDGAIEDGTAIPANQIVLQEFALRTGAADAQGTPVAARVLTAQGVNATAVTNAAASTKLTFPTSLALVPTAPLTASTTYTATFRATVRGRPVTQTWTFQTGTL
jgi:hypothetical protein